MAIATFGRKVFDVSSKKIYTPDNISISESLNVEIQEVEGKKPSTHIKGLGAMKITFDLRLDCRFVNVKNEVTWWLDKMHSKIPEVLTIGGTVWGSNKFLLVSVDVSDLQILKNGIYSKATLGLEFEEYVSAGYNKTAKKKTAKKKGSSCLNLSASAMKIVEANKKK